VFCDKVEARKDIEIAEQIVKPARKARSEIDIRSHWESVWKKENGAGTSFGCYFISKEDIKDKKVLELGCGDLSYTCDIDMPKFYLGLDIAANALHDAKGAYKDAVLIQANAFRLPLAEKSFDSVVSIQTMSTMGEYAAQVVAETARVMKRGGRMVFDFVHSDWYAAYDEFERVRMDHGVLYKGLDKEVMTYDKEGIERLLTSVGLRMESATVFTYGQFSNMGASPHCRDYSDPNSNVNADMLVRALRT
jgi:SAM-dependent methyltransferase